MTWSSYGAMLNGQNTNLTDLNNTAPKYPSVNLMAMLFVISKPV